MTDDQDRDEKRADRAIAADGPTVRLTPPPPPPPPEATPPEDAAAAEEETPPPADDEPTRARPRIQDGGATVRLQPSEPEPTPAPEPEPQPEAQEVSPDPVKTPDPAQPVPSGDAVPVPKKRVSSAGALIWVLLALLGFTLVVQLRSNDADAGLASARQEDLVGILSDLEARDQRLQQEINTLEESQRQLTSGVAGRQAALAEAEKRADELGLLSGTLPARGPGLKISIDPRGAPIKASSILNAVQELRGAGGEVMELVGDNGVAVRIVASSYFVESEGGEIVVDGKRLSGPYTLWVIGVPATMQTALQIPGGVVASVSQGGGNVTMEQRSTVEVAAVRQPTSLQYARPVS
jgi:uncharacterized protein YlxW (UPF0749 family)